MLQRVALIAGGINVGWLLLYAVLGSPQLVAVGLVGVGLYAAAWLLLARRRNRIAVALIWLEVLGHATAGSLLLGWDSGFHYFLILFIPALVMGQSPARAFWGTLALLAAYAALYAACAVLGPQRPLPAPQATVALWVNIALVFGMSYAVAVFYRKRVVAAERRLLEMATIDPLTGLANRVQFHSRALAELSRARRTGEPLTLLIADVDHFKRVNDEHGHDVGDRVLIGIADRLRAGLRECDVLARWGGEEFLALLPDCDADDARAVAERLRGGVADLRLAADDGHALALTLSIGIAGIGPDHDLRDAVTRADRALYRSKHAGRNRVSVEPAGEPGAVAVERDAPPVIGGRAATAADRS
jgi:diguanylate cyclase (GGDEF)-like protein